MTDPRVAALAAALHDEWDRRQGEPSEPGVLCPACVDSAAAILAALDGWTLVPNGSADWDCGYREGYTVAEAKMGDAAADDLLGRRPRMGDSRWRALCHDFRVYAQHAPNCACLNRYPAVAEPTCDCAFDVLLDRYDRLGAE